jgi:hypothetical protein
MFASELQLHDYAQAHALAIAWGGTELWSRWQLRLPPAHFKASLTMVCTANGMQRVSLLPQKLMTGEKMRNTAEGLRRAEQAMARRKRA